MIIESAGTDNYTHKLYENILFTKLNQQKIKFEKMIITDWKELYRSGYQCYYEGYDNVIFMKRVKLVIDKYQIGSIIYELPKDKITNHHVYLLIKTYNGKYFSSRLINYKLQPYCTVHTSESNSCLGSEVLLENEEIRNVGQLKSMTTKLIDLFSVINPYSPLCNMNQINSPKLRNAYRYVLREMRKYENERRGEEQNE